MKVSLISSNDDIGHKFIQDGIIRVFKEVLLKNQSNIKIDFQVINKHATVYSKNYYEHATKKLLNSDLIIFAGGPIIWPYVERSDWARTLASAVIQAANLGIPICAIAVGSCYGLDIKGRPVIDYVGGFDFIRPILERCIFITTRDKIAQKIISSMGLHNITLPCIAYYSMPCKKLIKPDTKILLNYMRGASHHDYLNLVSSQNWRNDIQKICAFYSSLFKIEFICHSVPELELVPLINSTCTSKLIIRKKDFVEIAKGTTIGICNRLHASIGLAGLGIPSLTIGSDSRIFSMIEFGLPYLSVYNASFKNIRKSVDELVENRDFYSNKIRLIIKNSTEAYKRLIKNHINHTFITV